MPVILKAIAFATAVILCSHTAIGQFDSQRRLTNQLYDSLRVRRAQDRDNSVFIFALFCKAGRLQQVNLLEVKDSVRTTILNEGAFTLYEPFLLEASKRNRKNHLSHMVFIFPFFVKHVDPNVEKLTILYPEYTVKNYSDMLAFLMKQAQNFILMEQERITVFPPEH